MEGDFKIDLLSVCKLFEKYSVQYMIIGGTAVAYHGYSRMSKDTSGEICEKPDIDVWYNPTYSNYYNILKVIESLGKDISRYKDEQNIDPNKSFFKLDFTNFTLDLLPKIQSKIRFTDANAKKDSVNIDGIEMHFISFEDLVDDKKSSGRKKDIEDIEQLKKSNNKNI
ncbi:hypothetical protein [Chryseobacterium sp. EO14]|uniref:hypothetical protein n=1 Tax=Chryseobacterium sp. EO14 TaxID=2950551 RepID=UPI00210E7FCB|nr:hypothetical protein [Chryseobacterium sp. EO14]MCQ4140964.1 hypothetical protein [Chryseobacterium sp. EO14]